MPPKKKARPALRAASTTGDDPVTPRTPLHQPLSAPEPALFDGWTDEQETTLFKAISIYRLKPAGMHKHFRIIGIAELMKNHGVSGTHTGIAGIWAKLRTLYNLRGLDEREDAPDADADDDDYDDDDSDDRGPPGGWIEFALPDADFGELMRARRVDPHTRDSPARVWKDSADESAVEDRDGMPPPPPVALRPADVHRFVARGVACRGGGCRGNTQGWHKGEAACARPETNPCEG